MRSLARILLAPVMLAAMLLWTLTAGPAVAQPQTGLDTAPLTIETTGGNRFDFDVELARTPEQRQIGMMFREEMAANAGMLFVFESERPQMFWMKNTLIPLDMLFIRGDGTIANIAKRAVPHDTTVGRYGSSEPVRYVLELNGGVTDLLGIAPGDRVTSEAMTGAPAAE